MTKLELIDKLRKALLDMDVLLEEKRKAHVYQYYLAQGHYKPDDIVRHPLRKSKVRVCNAVACPVRYDNQWNVTHVLCWMPESDSPRWLNMKTGQFDTKDLQGIPDRFHLNTKEEMAKLKARRGRASTAT